MGEIINLSTPHGALGTNYTNNSVVSALCLSTPHGALGTRTVKCGQQFSGTGLSTPHGALGTPILWLMCFLL